MYIYTHIYLHVVPPFLVTPRSTRLNLLPWARDNGRAQRALEAPRNGYLIVLHISLSIYIYIERERYTLI